MLDFKKVDVTVSILKLQKYDKYQNGVEFRHKPNDDDVKWPPPLFCLPPPLLPAKSRHTVASTRIMLVQSVTICLHKLYETFFVNKCNHQYVQQMKIKVYHIIFYFYTRGLQLGRF